MSDLEIIEHRLKRIEAKIDLPLNPPVQICACGLKLHFTEWDFNTRLNTATSKAFCICGLVTERVRYL